MNKVLKYLREQEEKFVVANDCPKHDSSAQVGKAATSFHAPNRQQQMRYCGTSDYGNCPVYLGQALRSSCSQGFARESLIDSGK